jgi:hypothetical protein
MDRTLVYIAVASPASPVGDPDIPVAVLVQLWPSFEDFHTDCATAAQTSVPLPANPVIPNVFASPAFAEENVRPPSVERQRPPEESPARIVPPGNR